MYSSGVMIPYDPVFTVFINNLILKFIYVSLYTMEQLENPRTENFNFICFKKYENLIMLQGNDSNQDK